MDETGNQIIYEQGFHDGYGQAMTEMPKIVRCKDCIHWDRNLGCGNISIYSKPDWFCADGKDGEQE